MSRIQPKENVVTILIMNYEKLYSYYMNLAKSSGRYKGDGNIYEIHHIIPRSVCSDLIKDPNNLVLLKPREHFLAHLALTRIYKNRGDLNSYYKMLSALFQISPRVDGNLARNSRLYEKARLEYYVSISKRNKGKKWTEEQKKKLKGRSAWNKGLHGVQKCSEETRRKLSEASRKHIVTPEEIEKRVATRRRNGSYGHSEETKRKIAALRPYYNKYTGEKRMFIPGSEPENFIDNEAFKKTDFYRPYVFYTNGIENRRLHEGDIPPEGFYRGVVKKEYKNANKTKGSGGTRKIAK